LTWTSAFSPVTSCGIVDTTETVIAAEACVATKAPNANANDAERRQLVDFILELSPMSAGIFPVGSKPTAGRRRRHTSDGTISKQCK
jgi:hypothetical protein